MTRALQPSAAGRTRTARGDATRRRIVRTVRKQIVKHGPAGLSLRSAAAAAGISLSNLQFHFASQDELLRAVLDDELAYAQAFVVRAIAAQPADPVSALIDALLALQHERNAAQLFFSLWALSSTSRHVRAALHGFYADWIERMAEVAAPDARHRAWVFVALIEGASLFRCGVTAASAPSEAALRDALRTLLGYGGRR